MFYKDINTYNILLVTLKKNIMCNNKTAFISNHIS